MLRGLVSFRLSSLAASCRSSISTFRARTIAILRRRLRSPLSLSEFRRSLRRFLNSAGNPMQDAKNSAPSKTALQDSTNVSATSSGQSAPVSNASGGVASVTIGGAVGYIALALVLVQMLFCYGLWSRYDLLRLFYEDIKTELIRQGMNPHPHMPKESP